MKRIRLLFVSIAVVALGLVLNAAPALASELRRKGAKADQPADIDTRVMTALTKVVSRCAYTSIRSIAMAATVNPDEKMPILARPGPGR